MAENKKTEEQKKPGCDAQAEELVEYAAPFDPTGEKPDILVGVNGEIIRIKRGQSVKIKRKFLEALQNANAQEMEAYKLIHSASK